jgi:hypothetical protein
VKIHKFDTGTKQCHHQPCSECGCVTSWYCSQCKGWFCVDVGKKQSDFQVYSIEMGETA